MKKTVSNDLKRSSNFKSLRQSVYIGEKHPSSSQVTQKMQIYCCESEARIKRLNRDEEKIMLLDEFKKGIKENREPVLRLRSNTR